MSGKEALDLLLEVDEPGTQSWSLTGQIFGTEEPKQEGDPTDMAFLQAVKKLDAYNDAMREYREKLDYMFKAYETKISQQMGINVPELRKEKEAIQSRIKEAMIASNQDQKRIGNLLLQIKKGLTKGRVQPAVYAEKLASLLRQLLNYTDVQLNQLREESKSADQKTTELEIIKVKNEAEYNREKWDKSMVNRVRGFLRSIKAGLDRVMGGSDALINKLEGIVDVL
jgi:hypothetical protein